MNLEFVNNDKERFGPPINVRLDKRILQWIKDESEITGETNAGTIRRLIFLGMKVQKLENEKRPELFREVALKDVEMQIQGPKRINQSERLEKKEALDPE